MSFSEIPKRIEPLRPITLPQIENRTSLTTPPGVIGLDQLVNRSRRTLEEFSVKSTRRMNFQIPVLEWRPCIGMYRGKPPTPPLPPSPPLDNEAGRFPSADTRHATQFRRSRIDLHRGRRIQYPPRHGTSFTEYQDLTNSMAHQGESDALRRYHDTR